MQLKESAARSLRYIASLLWLYATGPSFEKMNPQLCFFLKKPSLVIVAVDKPYSCLSVCVCLSVCLSVCVCVGVCVYDN